MYEDSNFSITLRESIPRQVDKKSRGPQGEGDLEFSRRKKGQTFFCLHSLVLVNYTTQFKLCTRDYIITMYPAWGQFLLPENLLANPVIFKCKLWEWVY